MEIGLGWICLSLGIVGTVAAFTWAGSMSQRAEVAEETLGADGGWCPATFCLLVTLVFWGISVRTSPPFSQGQSLGWGFLIGGLAACAAMLMARRLGRADAESPAPSAIGLICECSLGLFAVSLAYVLFRTNPQWALMGVAIGAVLGGIVSLISPSHGKYALAFTVFSVTLAAAVLFAVRHFDETALRLWWPVPLLVGATALVAAFVGVGVSTLRQGSGDRPRCAVLPVAASAAVALALNAIYSWKLVTDWHLFYSAAVGIGAACLISWMAAAVRSESGGSAFRACAASALVIAALAVAGFKLWAGLGIAVGLLAAWTVTIPVVGAKSNQEPSGAANIIGVVRGLLLLGPAILLFRLFIELYGSDLRGADLRIHYTFVGAVLGVMMTRVLMTGMPRETQAGLIGLVNVAFLGLVAAAAPLVILLVWGIKALLGLVFGLVAVLVLGYIGRPEDEAPSAGVPAEAMLAFGAQLTAVVFTAPLVDIELRRSQRIWILAVAAAVAVVWFLVSCALSRRTAE